MDKRQGFLIILLIVFVFSSIGLAMWQVRRDLLAASGGTVREGEHEAWVKLERFFRNNESCTAFLQQQLLGARFLGGRGQGPKVGQEWGKSGQLVKDMYLLRREEEIAWMLSKGHEQEDPLNATVYLKISLVPKLGTGLPTVDHLMNAQGITRLIPIKVALAHRQVYQGCQRQALEAHCYRLARTLGVRPVLALERRPASQGASCQDGAGHQVVCWLPAPDAPIWRCQH